MKGIVIINAYPSGEKFIRQGERIAAELRALGVECTLLKNGEVYALMQEDGRIESNLPKDCAFAVYLDKDKYLGRMLERQGLRLFNRAEAIENCDDKLRTYLALADSGVPVVKSIPAPLCYTKGTVPSEIFLKNVATELGFPLVAKKSYGSFGDGVQLVHGYAELFSFEKKCLYTPHFYQSYVAESCGRDIRALVIGGKVIAAMERVASEGEFRSNIELGGVGRALSIPLEYAEVAVRAAKALGLDYCGVDLLEGRRGAIVCEVNSNAFFEGLEGTTGVNVARAYANYIFAAMLKE